MLHAPLPVDGGGTVRHIARETFRHPILSEATTSRDFLWALHSLWKPASPDHCEATLIDTLIVSSGEWFFTNKDGFIVKKTEKGSTPDALRAAFVKMSEGYGIDRSGRPFAVGYTADGRCTVRILLIYRM